MLAAGRQGRYDYGLVAALFLLGQEFDKGGFKRCAGGALQQLGGCACGKYAAIVHGDEPVKTLGFVHVGSGYDDAHAGAVLPNAGNQVPKLGACQRVYACGGLIEYEQVGVVNQGAAKPQLLLHAAREFARRTA